MKGGYMIFGDEPTLYIAIGVVTLFVFALIGYLSTKVEKKRKNKKQNNE
jgi:hypothetical protein